MIGRVIAHAGGDNAFFLVGAFSLPPRTTPPCFGSAPLLSGLWHGANWNFVLWGAVHGLGVLPQSLTRRQETRGADEIPGGPGRWPRPKTVLAMLTTFSLSTFAWVFFRANTFSDASLVFQRIANDAVHLSGFTTSGLHTRNAAAAAAAIVALLITEWFTRDRPHPLAQVQSWPVVIRWSLYTLLLWGAVFLSPPQANPFIYFQF